MTGFAKPLGVPEDHVMAQVLERLTHLAGADSGKLTSVRCDPTLADNQPSAGRFSLERSR